jgi:hypothetical protein
MSPMQSKIHLSIHLKCNNYLEMFITNAVLANTILDRGFFCTLKEATRHAKEQTREKIWKLPNNTVFFGDVEVRVYNTDDYKNEHFLSFIDSQ